MSADDLAQQILAGRDINVTMGYFNAIWQGDSNAMTLRALDCVASPPFVVNVAGPEELSVRRMAQEFGRVANDQGLKAALAWQNDKFG